MRRRAGMQSRGARGVRGLGGLHWSRARGKKNLRIRPIVRLIAHGTVGTVGQNAFTNRRMHAFVVHICVTFAHAIQITGALTTDVRRHHLSRPVHHARAAGHDQALERHVGAGRGCGGAQVSCPAPGTFSHLFLNSFSRCEGNFRKKSSGSGSTGRVCARRADAKNDGKTTAKRRRVTRHIVTLQLRRLSDGQRGGCCRHAMAARALVSEFG